MLVLFSLKKPSEIQLLRTVRNMGISCIESGNVEKGVYLLEKFPSIVKRSNYTAEFKKQVEILLSTLLIISGSHELAFHKMNKILGQDVSLKD